MWIEHNGHIHSLEETGEVRYVEPGEWFVSIYTGEPIHYENSVPTVVERKILREMIHAEDD